MTQNSLRTILLVDDEQAVRHITGRLLKQSGYCVLEASNALEALGVFDQQGEAISIVITDMIMPGAHGLELGARLSEKRPDLPILYISGYPGERFNRELGPNEDFLGKPFLLSELAAKVRRLLGEA